MMGDVSMMILFPMLVSNVLTKAIRHVKLVFRLWLDLRMGNSGPLLKKGAMYAAAMVKAGRKELWRGLDENS